MVTPFALIAATPVGATTINLFKEFAFNECKNVVFPVPALPVKKIDRSVFSTKSHAKSNSGFSGIQKCKLENNKIYYSKIENTKTK